MKNKIDNKIISNAKKEYIKNNYCCINNEYKKIDTSINNIDIGLKSICKNCYNELI